MPLDKIIERKIPYAICTDVGASTTTSILNEMAQFLKVHSGRSNHATPTEALYRSTLAPLQILNSQTNSKHLVPLHARPLLPKSKLTLPYYCRRRNFLHGLLELNDLYLPGRHRPRDWQTRMRPRVSTTSPRRVTLPLPIKKFSASP